MRETLVKSEDFKDSPLSKIPKNWNVKTLGELGTFQNGLNKSKKDFGFGTKFVNISDVYPERLNIDLLGRMNATESEIGIYRLVIGDILIDRSSVKLDGVGYPTLFEGADEPIIFCGFIIRFRLLNSDIKPRFVCEVMRDDLFRNRVFQIATRSANVNVNQEQLAKLVIAFPPVPQQEEIIEILDTLNQAIARTSSLIAKLKQMKAGLLHELLTRGLDENGELRDAIAHPEQFKDSPLGRIPIDWEVNKFEKLADAIDPQPDHRAPPEVSNGEPYVGVGDFRPDGSIDFNACKKVSLAAVTKQQQRFSIEQGDIIFGKIGTIGLPKFLPHAGRRYALNANTVLIKPRECPAFVMCLLQSNLVEQQIKLETHSTSQPAFGILRIRAMLVPIPSPKEQQRIAAVLDAHETLIFQEEAYCDKLKLQKQGLMQDLLTGKTRVK